jgi:hypothetical protein
MKLCLIVFLGEGRALNFHTIIRPNLLIILGITKLPSIIISICFLRHPLPVTQACFKRSAFHVSNAFKTIENQLKCLNLLFLMRSAHEKRDVWNKPHCHPLPVTHLSRWTKAVLNSLYRLAEHANWSKFYKSLPPEAFEYSWSRRMIFKGHIVKIFRIMISVVVE